MSDLQLHKRSHGLCAATRSLLHPHPSVASRLTTCAGQVLEQSYGYVGKNPPSGRKAGIVLHPTSLDGPFGTGDLGQACFAFVDWLANSGMRAWQVCCLIVLDCCLEHSPALPPRSIIILSVMKQ